MITVLDGGVVQGTRRSTGVLWPTNRASRQPLVAFDAKPNSDVFCRAFSRGPRPDIIAGTRTRSIGILKDVKTYPVAMLELF